MAKVTYQNQKGAIEEVHHYGCYCDSLYNFKSLIQGIDTSIEELNGYWEKAKSLGIIDNNPKSKTYLEILKPQALVDLMKLPLQYIDGKFSPSTKIPENTYVISAWFNDRTKFVHFVVYDPVNKKVLFDPIYPKSITCKEGVLLSYRFYKIVGDK